MKNVLIKIIKLALMTFIISGCYYSESSSTTVTSIGDSNSISSNSSCDGQTGVGIFVEDSQGNFVCEVGAATNDPFASKHQHESDK